jgi:CarboxypepD_reg-like domain
MNFTKTIALLTLFCCPIMLVAQTSITGKIIAASDKKPLLYASVFISNTTKGQQTDENGAFQLNDVPAGEIDLVVTYVGFKRYSKRLKADTLTRPLLIVLYPDEINLGGVTIRELRYGFKEYYPLFLEYFIGKTNFSESCKLLNPKDLRFARSEDGNEVIITAAKPLMVENKALGYTVQYELQEFRYDLKGNYVSFMGYPFFKEMTTKREKQKKKWIENRKIAYWGSLQHFCTSLRNQTSAKEGFTMFELVRELKKVVAIPVTPEKRDSLGTLISPASKAVTLVEASDLKLKNNPNLKKIPTGAFSKYVQYLYNTPLQDTAISRLKDGDFYLNFDNYLYLVYAKEQEEPQFLQQGQIDKSQVSILSLLESPVLVEKNGSLRNPLSVLLEGRLGREKMGEFLPIDYVPD